MRPTGEAMLGAVRRAVSETGVDIGVTDARARVRLEAAIDREVAAVAEIIGVCEDCGGLCENDNE